MPLPFQRAYPPVQAATGPALWFPFQAGKLLVQEHKQQLALIEGDETTLASLQPSPVLYLGTLHEKPCLTCEVSAEQALPTGWHAREMRSLFGSIDDNAYAVAGYASHLLRWQHDHRYCPACGHLTETLPASWARLCPRCGHTSYPTVTPAVLVLIHDGDRVLLAHKPGWGKRRSILAGFVEPGESLEECVQREVQEEVNLEVTDIRYVASQPWPYPDQLMVGFMARYKSGTIQPDYQELAGADWYRYDALPELPPPLSLARQIIMKWVASQQQHTPAGTE